MEDEQPREPQSLELSKFKLLLNIKKTEVISLPEAISSNWVIELSTRIPAGEEINPYQAIQFIDFAVALSKRHPEGSVLKFAFKSLINKKLDFFSSLDVLRYGMVLSFHNPVLLPLFEKMLKEAWILPETHEQLNRIVRENARLYRSDGMCWGLYLLFQATAQVEEDTANDVLKTGDVFSILMLYYIGQHTDKVVAFCNGINKEDSYALDCYWLLLYQVYLDGSIGNPYTDGVFEIMKKHDVTFFSPGGKEDCLMMDIKKIFAVEAGNS